MTRRCLAVPVACVLALVVLSAGLLLSAPQTKPKSKKVALLVGVTRYDSSHFPNLKYTDNDVEEMAKILQRPGSGFTSVRVLTSRRGKKNRADAPTAANIRKALKELLEGRTKRDLVLIG